MYFAIAMTRDEYARFFTEFTPRWLATIHRLVYIGISVYFYNIIVIGLYTYEEFVGLVCSNLLFI